MCGIVGLFLKDKSLEPELGALLSSMLVTMTDRGPDSAGIAIYGDASGSNAKITIQSANPKKDFAGLEAELGQAVGARVAIQVKSTHAVITLARDLLDAGKAAVAELRPNVRIMSSGDAIEIYKETGLPKDVVSRFAVNSMAGTHGIGHTRMATESAVTTLGAHPFSTGSDQCLVHNGSLSNHNNLRRELKREGMTFETENDTEVAAAYLTAEMAKGKNLGQALKGAVDDLDGFFTFVVGTENGFAVLRDPIACKPAVMAETDDWVAMASEYRAIAVLPGANDAQMWEPEPAKVYVWERERV
jgi:glutamate synthase domain-containing protein 1